METAKAANTSKKKNGLKAYIGAHPWLYVMVLPGLIYLITFKYFPMLGIVIAFQDFSPFLGYFGSSWVGFEHFANMFSDPDFPMLFFNTLALSLLNLLFYFPAPVILALALNEIKTNWYKRACQTLVYIPHFISYVIVASLTYTLLNVNDGVINQILVWITGGKPVNFMGLPEYFRGIIVGQNIWKESGYGTIVFLAALSGVDINLYEAARVDGAGRWRLMWHITLPAIKSTIIIMLILRVGSIMNTGFEQIFLLRNSLNIRTSEVFDTYVYVRGIQQGQYSYATATGLFKSVIGMFLVLSANWIAKKNGESGIY